MNVIELAVEMYRDWQSLPDWCDEENAPTPPKAVWAQCYHNARALRYCEEHGHEWVDESHGGPDSGCISMYCRRCGYSHHVTLY